MYRRIVIDTDPGVDDALALILALRSPEIRVEAVTTVGGNVDLEQTTRNAIRILSMVDPKPPPLLGKGRNPPAGDKPVRAQSVHGRDGLGELERFLKADGSPMYPEVDVPRDLPQATEVISELLDRYPDEILLVTLGPLTNLAELLTVAPKRARRLQRVIVMGGAIGVAGNVTPGAEFNILADPVSASRVFASGLPISLVPLDVTRQVKLGKELLEGLKREGCDRVAGFLIHATAKALEFMEAREGSAFLALHDPLAVGVAIDPSLVETVPLHVEVETRGEITLGMTVADRRPILPHFKEKPNVDVAVGVDAERFLKLFRERVCPGWWS